MSSRTPHPATFIITGGMAAGKSSVAQALAERMRSAVHLRGDVFRRMIVRGRLELGSDADPAALEQLRLRYRIAAEAARAYRAARLSVVYQDVIIGPMLDEVLALHARPLYLVVLDPTAEAIARREAGRAKRAYGAFSIEQMQRVLQEQTSRLGLWLDSSQLDIAQTVDQILARIDESALDPPSLPASREIVWLERDAFWSQLEVRYRREGRGLTDESAVAIGLADLRARISMPPTFTPAGDEDFPGPVERWYGHVAGHLFILTFYYHPDHSRMTRLIREATSDAEAIVGPAIRSLVEINPHRGRG